LAEEAQVTLGWFPGDRAARVFRIQTDQGELGNAGALVEMADLTSMGFGPLTHLLSYYRYPEMRCLAIFGEQTYPDPIERFLIRLGWIRLREPN
jgi:hypothetical protein